MLLLKKPSQEAIGQFIKGQQALPFSYAAVGITKEGICAKGYGKDHVRGQLGSGEDAFRAAVSAFEKWEQFNVGWVEVYPRNALIIPNSVVAVLAWHGSFWSLNACRIIYVINEQGPLNRFGFGYGTLPEHAESGEERFLIEWDRSQDIVFYDVIAFSNPNFILGWLAYPLVRYIQNSFRRDSERVMKRMISSGN
jgi:uncharacterized protein (UPF0548 family)